MGITNTRLILNGIPHDPYHSNLIDDMTRLFKLKQPEERASENINIRTTKATRAEIERRAKLRNITISKYMIRTALGRPIRTNNVSEIVIELNALSDQQRELFKSDRRNEHKYMEILQAIVKALLAIQAKLKF